MQEKQVYAVSDIISVLLECGATKNKKGQRRSDQYLFSCRTAQSGCQDSKG